MPLPPSLEAVALAHYRQQVALGVAVADLAVELWRATDPADWSRVAGALGLSVEGAQQAAAAPAMQYVADALDAQGATADPEFEVNPAGLSGVVESTLPLDATLAVAPLATLNRSLVAGFPEQVATARALVTLVTVVSTAVADAGRQADSVATLADRRTRGYVRMLVRPSCSRCVVLAGRHYRSATAFDRHPRCDCRHVPAAEDTGTDLATDPAAYFRSLTRDQQARVFTDAGARAIRDGADVAQVVNARSGADGLTPAGSRITDAEARALRGGRARGRLTTRDVLGRPVSTTTAGTTVRGTAGRRLAEAGGTRRSAGDRYARARSPRLMPESIYSITTDRDEQLRLLRRNGYLL